MKAKLKAYGGVFWRLLTEVPGWPDAPLWMRLGRALPVTLPCIGMIAILGWHLCWHGPRVRAERAVLEPLIALEDEISILQVQWSDSLAAEFAERAVAASRLLLESPQELAGYLRVLKKEAADRGWEAVFVAGDTSAETPPEGAAVRWLPVRGKLTPPKDADRFATLLSLLERFSSAGKRIDLMRLAIRVDDNRWQAVELNLRLACPVAHEKTP